MSTTSLLYFAFLAVVLFAAWLTPSRYLRETLIVFSAIFYIWAGVTSAGMLFSIVAMNYMFVRAMASDRREAVRDRLYWLAIAINLAIFVALKLTLEPSPGAPTRALHLAGIAITYPLGLSFVLLMMHSAVSDAYTGAHRSNARLGTFFLFGTFFPYVTAGPVERLKRMEPQFVRHARPTRFDLIEGATLIALGLVKKFAVANRLKPYIDNVFAGDVAYPSAAIALAMILNAAYIYCDFSSYTDIARGSARCLGIELSINFDRPFTSRSVTEFWRRWHMSFSTWLRDYIYMPLAFSMRRLGPSSTVISLLVTFLICGFWHRAAWTFVLFGLLHGAVMAVELLASRRGRVGVDGTSVIGRLLQHGYTLVFLVATIVLFSARDLSEALRLFHDLFTHVKVPSAGAMFANRGPIMFLLMGVAFVLWHLFEAWTRKLNGRGNAFFFFAAAVVLLFLGNSGEAEFIYAQF